MSISRASEGHSDGSSRKTEPSVEQKALWAERIYLRFRKEELVADIASKQSEILPLKESLAKPGPKDSGRIAQEQRSLYVRRRIKEVDLDLKEIDEQLKAINQRLRRLETE